MYFLLDSLLDLERFGTAIKLSPMPSILVPEINVRSITRPTIMASRRKEAYFMSDILVEIKREKGAVADAWCDLYNDHWLEKPEGKDFDLLGQLLGNDLPGQENKETGV